MKKKCAAAAAAAFGSVQCANVAMLSFFSDDGTMIPHGDPVSLELPNKTQDQIGE